MRSPLCSPRFGSISCKLGEVSMDTVNASEVTVVQLPPAFVGEQAVYGPNYRGGLAPPPEWWAKIAHPMAPWPPGPVQYAPQNPRQYPPQYPPQANMQYQCYWQPPPPTQQVIQQLPMQAQFCWPPPPQFSPLNCYAVIPGLSYQPMPAWQPPTQFQVPCYQAPPAPAPMSASYISPPPPPAAAPQLGAISSPATVASSGPPRPSWADISEEVPPSVPPSPCQHEASASSTQLPNLLGSRAPKASHPKKGRKRT